MNSRACGLWMIREEIFHRIGMRFMRTSIYRPYKLCRGGIDCEWDEKGDHETHNNRP